MGTKKKKSSEDVGYKGEAYSAIWAGHVSKAIDFHTKAKGMASKR